MHWIKIQPYIIYSVASICSFIIGLVLLEIILRFTPAHISILRPIESEGYYERNTDRVLDIKPNVTSGKLSFYGVTVPFWSNELGCFDTPYASDTPFIYLAGDSLSWGYTTFEDKWGTQLQNVLNIRILKCAVSATGTHHQFLKAEEILNKHPNPKIILVGYYADNDVLDDAQFPLFVTTSSGVRADNPNPGTMPTDETYKMVDRKMYYYNSYCTTSLPSHPILQSVKCFLYRHSVAYVLITRGIKSVFHVENGDGKATVFPAPTADQFKKNFASILQFKNLAAKQNAQLVFVLIPSREEVYPEIFGSSQAASTTEVIKQFLGAHAIDYIDLKPTFSEIARLRKESSLGTAGDLYWPIEWHMNPLGNTVTAYAVGKYLYAHNFIDRNQSVYNNLSAMLTKIFTQ